MKATVFLLSLLTFGLISCSNQAPETPAVDNVETPVNPDSTRFTIGNNQNPTDSIVKNGESIEHYKNGVIRMRGIMKDGKREGLWKSWYENGTPWSETTFADGKKTGKTTTWYENGQKRYEGFYTEDKESGAWIFWDETGKETNRKDYGKK